MATTRFPKSTKGVSARRGEGRNETLKPCLFRASFRFLYHILYKTIDRNRPIYLFHSYAYHIVLPGLSEKFDLKKKKELFGFRHRFFTGGGTATSLPGMGLFIPVSGRLGFPKHKPFLLRQPTFISTKIEAMPIPNPKRQLMPMCTGMRRQP